MAVTVTVRWVRATIARVGMSVSGSLLPGAPSVTLSSVDSATGRTTTVGGVGHRLATSDKRTFGVTFVGIVLYSMTGTRVLHLVLAAGAGCACHFVFMRPVPPRHPSPPPHTHIPSVSFPRLPCT